MSQSGRLTLNQPVPGAGVQTVTGNVGGAVPGDGAANINIVGAGGIVVTGNPGANTLTITDNNIAAQFLADDANIATPLAGTLSILGTANQVVTSAPGALHTIQIGLPDNVTINDTLTAQHLVAGVDTTTGDLIATGFADIGGNLVVQGGSGLEGGAHIENVLWLDANAYTLLDTLSFPLGVMQVRTSTHILGFNELFSDNGANGQILIGGGASPAWANITAGANINIVNGGNSITISADLDIASQYNTDAGIAIPAVNVLQVLGGTNINTAGAGNALTINLDDSIALAGSVSVGTTLTVTGTTTLNGALQANGFSTFNDDVTLLGGAALVLTGRTNGVLTTGGTGIVSATNGANGQLLIGGGAAPAWSSLTSGNGSITILPGANSLDVRTTVGANFKAYKFASTVNVTGDGTIFPLPLITTSWDLTGSYDTINQWFVAPVNGIYGFGVHLTASGFSAAHTSSLLRIVNLTAGGDVWAWEGNPYAVRATNSNRLDVTGHTTYQVNAGDAIYVLWAVYGGTKTVTLSGGASTTFFYGYLIQET